MGFKYMPYEEAERKYKPEGKATDGYLKAVKKPISIFQTLRWGFGRLKEIMLVLPPGEDTGSV